MGLIVDEETYEVTVQRIEDTDGNHEYTVKVDEEVVDWGRRSPRVQLPSIERNTLVELAYKGRMEALEYLYA